MDILFFSTSKVSKDEQFLVLFPGLGREERKVHKPIGRCSPTQLHAVAHLA